MLMAHIFQSWSAMSYHLFEEACWKLIHTLRKHCQVCSHIKKYDEIRFLKVDVTQEIISSHHYSQVRSLDNLCFLANPASAAK